MKREHCIIEALLFVSPKSIPSSKVAEILKIETKEATQLIEEYSEILSARVSALQVVRDPDGYKLGTRLDYAQYVEMLLAPKETRLSYQALETLSIIAFKQPITKQEIEKIRGINSDGIINSLYAKGLTKIVGFKKVAGTPKLYGISRDFFKYFGIKSMGELKNYLKSIEIDTSKIDALLAEENKEENIIFDDPNQELFDFEKSSGASAEAASGNEIFEEIITENPEQSQN
ncbi:MAG: SMC-Scp complex subunit ScpB [Candidatus Wallbacteria bacterium]